MLTKKNTIGRNSFVNDSIAKENITNQVEDKIYWRKKGSNLKGYDYTIFTKRNRRLYQVDYSLPSLKIRLLLENSDGRRFWSEIQKGKIIRSNSIIKSQNGSTEIPDPISEEKEVFSKIPDRNVFNLISGNHGIGQEFSGKPVPAGENNGVSRSGTGQVISALDDSFQSETRKRYFQNPLFETSQSRKKFSWPRLSDIFNLRFFRNMIETAIILLIGFMALYYQWVSPLSTGAIIATSGIVLGGVDMLGRNEEPSLSKVMILLVCGGVLFFNNYFT